ncbi:MAG: tRNA lysidine(34) synthetase TilS [Puniceicoccales bacterium]
MSDWTNSARRLGSQVDELPLHPAVTDWLDARPGATLGVACSGGADSLALLLILWARLRKKHPLRVLHFNHGLRGKDADADAAFVRDVAESLGLEFRLGQARFKPGNGVSEDKLRNARLAFFAKQECDAILLGHHANDVAETMVMRLCRGSGVAGLSAPQPISQPNPRGATHLRPLLNWSRETVENALVAASVQWREDITNRSPDFFRNRVRHNIWPNLVVASPTNALAGTLRSRQLLEEDAAALDTWLEAVMPDCPTASELDAAPLRGLPKALWRRALQRWLGQLALAEHLSADAVDALLEKWMWAERQRVSVGADHFIVGSADGLLKVEGVSHVPEWAAQVLPSGGQIALPNRSWLRAEWMLLTSDQRKDVLSGKVNENVAAFLDWKLEESPRLTVRLWEAGDRYQPLGAPGSRKLQDCFTDRKIPERERKRLPVVCDEAGNIVWVPGLPPSDTRRLREDCNWALWLTYRAF